MQKGIKRASSIDTNATTCFTGNESKSLSSSAIIVVVGISENSL
jgi:hypothetical protein